MAHIIDLADGVVADLNLDPLTNFGREFLAERNFGEFDEQLEDLGILAVDVVPIDYDESEMASRGLRTDAQTRGRISYEMSCNIGVRQKLRRDADRQKFHLPEVDPLIDVVQNIHDFFWQRELTTYTTAEWLDCNIEALYRAVDLKQWSQFTGIVSVTYRVVA